MSSSVGAGVGRSLVRRPPMPVKAQRCRIVAEPAIRGLEDNLRQMLYGFARVHLATGCEDRRDVDAFSVSLEHAVGKEHDSIAWLKWQRLHAILVAAVDAKRRVGRERQAGNATVTEPQRRRVDRGDDWRGAGGVPALTFGGVWRRGSTRAICRVPRPPLRAKSASPALALPACSASPSPARRPLRGAPTSHGARQG